jgi:hypothetical protein
MPVGVRSLELAAAVAMATFIVDLYIEAVGPVSPAVLRTESRAWLRSLHKRNVELGRWNRPYADPAGGTGPTLTTIAATSVADGILGAVAVATQTERRTRPVEPALR